MSSRAPSSVQPRRSSQPRRSAGPSSAPAAPRNRKTYISTFRTRYGPNTAPGATKNPHRVYGFRNSNGQTHILSTNSIRNKFRDVNENNNDIVRILKRRLRGIPKQYVYNIVTNIIPIREQASRNATAEHRRKVTAIKTERMRQNIALNKKFDRMSWANYEEKKNAYARNRYIENARRIREYTESLAAHQFEIDLWKKIQRLLSFYSNNVNYTRRRILPANQPSIRNLHRALQGAVRRLRQ